ncbi:hypothetical protein Tco_0826046 [Tanacetum coccineum]
MDEPEPQHAYDFFAPGPLPGELGEIGEPLRAEVDKPLVDPVIDELAEPIVEVEEQMVALVMDLAMLFGVEDDSSDDDFEGPEGDEEVWEMNEEWLMAPVTPAPMSVMPLLSTYEVGGSSTVAAEGHSLTLLAHGVPVPPSVIEDLCTRMGNLEYGHEMLVKKVMTAVSRLEQVGTRMEQDQQATTHRDEVISRISQQVQTLQAVVQHRDVQIQQLQTLVAEMSSREGTLMQCILGLDRRLADVERRSPGPQ